MATFSNWTVVFDDKIIIKQSGNDPSPYTIDDDSFWNQSKFSNIWAIQYKDDDHDYNDSVEYRDETPHSSWTDSGLGDFQDFIDKWDSAHLSKIQEDWDNNVLRDSENNNIVSETEEEKIARIGARPTSYSS